MLDHAAGSAIVTAGNGFLVRAGATGLTATISVNDAAGGRSGLEIAPPSIGGGSLSGGPAVPYLVSAGSAKNIQPLSALRHGRHVQRYGHVFLGGRQSVAVGARVRWARSQFPLPATSTPATRSGPVRRRVGRPAAIGLTPAAAPPTRLAEAECSATTRPRLPHRAPRP